LSTTSSTTGITPLTFTGTSQYASDFQSILDRAVQISSIPLTQLQNEDATVLSKNSQLATLQSAVANLYTAVQSLGTLAAGQAISATSSDPDSVSVTATGASSSASYTINSITTLAAAASETSNQVGGYANSASTPVSSTGVMQLVVGSTDYPINLTTATNNLNGLESAINSSGAPVTASVLTTGSGNYLSVTANDLGATTLKLMDDPTGANTDVLTSSNQGADASFEFDNLPITRSNNTVNDLISGATFTLEAPTTTPVTLTLAPDPSQLSSAIQTLVTNYNAVVSQIDAQSGPGAGVLSGDSIIWQTRSVMQQLTSYAGSGSIQSLADMGITLGQDGTMSFDQSTFNSLSASQIAGAFQFFGSATTGFGGLSSAVDQISDPITGTIAAEVTSNLSQDSSLQTQITNTSDSINTMQQNLLQQLSQADTLITTLNTQQSALSASVQSLDYVLYGYQSQASIA
jgi:flagellar hook-associated protein 2